MEFTEEFATVQRSLGHHGVFVLKGTGGLPSHRLVLIATQGARVPLARLAPVHETTLHDILPPTHGAFE